MLRRSRSLLYNLRIPNPVGKTPKYVSAEEAVKLIGSNQNVFLHGQAATPFALLRAMVERHSELKDVNVVQLHSEGEAPHAQPEYADSFRVHALFTGANTRKAIQEGRGDYHPIFLSEIDKLFERNIFPLDVALISVSVPDRHGFCTLGTSVDVALDAVKYAKTVIAQVNPCMPRTFGDSCVHISNIHCLIHHAEKLPTHAITTPSQEFQAIAKFIAELVEDGSTLQMGIGAIPDAVLPLLSNHKDLGIHTEMFSDGVLGLVKKGVITNRYKKILPGHIVSSFVVGSDELYDFLDDNMSVMMFPSRIVNDPANIKQNPKVVAINSCIEIDLTGQVCSDSIADKVYSGIGGQMDFERGASLSEGGHPIIAVTSRTNKGQPRIVPQLQRGAGVVTTRGHVHWVVTEYGRVNLFGKSIRERARLLIEIAHPDDRAALTASAQKIWGFKNL